LSLAAGVAETVMYFKAKHDAEGPITHDTQSAFNRSQDARVLLTAGFVLGVGLLGAAVLRATDVDGF
jgi:hypothetical protein